MIKDKIDLKENKPWYIFSYKDGYVHESEIDSETGRRGVYFTNNEKLLRLFDAYHFEIDCVVPLSEYKVRFQYTDHNWLEYIDCDFKTAKAAESSTKEYYQQAYYATFE